MYYLWSKARGCRRRTRTAAKLAPGTNSQCKPRLACKVRKRHDSSTSRRDMPSPKLTGDIISAAIAGYESRKQEIDRQISELQAMLSSATSTLELFPESVKEKGRRKMSAASRKRMAEAQQKRWADYRGDSFPATKPKTKQPTKKKRKISTNGRVALAEAQRKRWAAKKKKRGA